MEKGKIEDALTMIDNMITKLPDDDFLYYYKGLIYQSLGDNESADDWFKKANNKLKNKIGGLE